MNTNRISGLHGPIMLTTHSAHKVIFGTHTVILYLYQRTDCVLLEILVCLFFIPLKVWFHYGVPGGPAAPKEPNGPAVLAAVGPLAAALRPDGREHPLGVDGELVHPQARAGEDGVAEAGRGGG